MLTSEFNWGKIVMCQHCRRVPAEVTFNGFGALEVDLLHWCRNCAMHLSRMILEDLCEVITGDRH